MWWRVVVSSSTEEKAKKIEGLMNEEHSPDDFYSAHLDHPMYDYSYINKKGDDTIAFDSATPEALSDHEFHKEFINPLQTIPGKVDFLKKNNLLQDTKILPNKNIWMDGKEFNSGDELTEHINDKLNQIYHNEFYKRIPERSTSAGSGYNSLFNNESVELFEVTSQKGCVTLGDGTSWCVSDPKIGPGYYEKYRTESDHGTKSPGTFYYLNDKTRGPKDPLRRVMILVHEDPYGEGNYEYSITDMDNSTGRISEFGKDALGYIKYLSSKGVPVELIKPKPYSPEELKDKSAKLTSEKFHTLNPMEKIQAINQGVRISHLDLHYLKNVDYLINYYLNSGTILQDVEKNILFNDGNKKSKERFTTYQRKMEQKFKESGGKSDYFKEMSRESKLKPENLLAFLDNNKEYSTDSIINGMPSEWFTKENLNAVNNSFFRSTFGYTGLKKNPELKKDREFLKEWMSILDPSYLESIGADITDDMVEDFAVNGQLNMFNSFSINQLKNPVVLSNYLLANGDGLTLNTEKEIKEKIIQVFNISPQSFTESVIKTAAYKGLLKLLPEELILRLDDSLIEWILYNALTFYNIDAIQNHPKFKNIQYRLSNIPAAKEWIKNNIFGDNNLLKILPEHVRNQVSDYFKSTKKNVKENFVSNINKMTVEDLEKLVRKGLDESFFNMSGLYTDKLGNVHYQVRDIKNKIAKEIANPQLQKQSKLDTLIKIANEVDTINPKWADYLLNKIIGE